MIYLHLMKKRKAFVSIWKPEYSDAYLNKKHPGAVKIGESDHEITFEFPDIQKFYGVEKFYGGDNNGE